MRASAEDEEEDLHAVPEKRDAAVAEAKNPATGPSGNDRQSRMTESGVLAPMPDPVASQPVPSKAAVVSQHLASPAVESQLVVASQPVASQRVGPHPVIAQPTESPSLASQSVASQPVKSQPVTLAAPRFSAPGPTAASQAGALVDPASVPQNTASCALGEHGAIAPDALPPDALLGEWVRDGGKTYVVELN